MFRGGEPAPGAAGYPRAPRRPARHCRGDPGGGPERRPAGGPAPVREHGAAGAAFAADGKTINNVLGFPGLFRGALDAGADRFTDAMLVAAAEAIADCAGEGDLVPEPLDVRVHESVAAAVARAAVESGAAQ
ncbi:MAG: malic enzyme-like NAD(P)-binding protein [Gammaproteobacteria bacterium]